MFGGNSMIGCVKGFGHLNLYENERVGYLENDNSLSLHP
jgi:hypothetical protein